MALIVSLQALYFGSGFVEVAYRARWDASGGLLLLVYDVGVEYKARQRGLTFRAMNQWDKRLFQRGAKRIMDALGRFV